MRYLAGVAALCAACLALGGCSSSTISGHQIQVSPLATVSDPAPLPTEEETTAAPPPSPVAERAHVGDSVGVKDEAEDVVTVTLLHFKARVKATDEFSTPEKGYRYCAAQIQIAMPSGAQTYSDFPDNGAQVVDSEGQTYDSDTLESIDAGPLFPGQVNITAGHKAKGWIVFQVPTAARVATVQFSLESGFGDGAEWIVP